MSWTWMSKVCGFFLSRRTGAPSPHRRADAATSEELVAAIEDDALSRSDPALRRLELDRHGGILARADDTRHGFAARANLRIGLERSARRRRPRDPGHAIRLERPPAEELLGAYDDAVRRRIDLHDVLPRPRGDAEPAPLPDRVAEGALVRSDRLARRIDELSRARELRPALLDERRVVGPRNEAHLLGVGLARDGETEAFGLGTRLALPHLPQGEERARELPLAQHVKHVGLVLRPVGATEESPAVPGLDVPRVMAGRDEVDPEVVGAVEEGSELDAFVASDARVRRATRLVLVEEVGEDRSIERLGHVEDLEREAGDPRDVGRVGSRPGTTAAVLHSLLRAIEMDEIHVRAEHLEALLLEQARGDGGIHAAGHADQHRGTRAHAFEASTPAVCGSEAAPN